jgi:hypothetical protein
MLLDPDPGELHQYRTENITRNARRGGGGGGGVLI